MKSALTLWANLEAARDDSSMNLSFLVIKHLYPKHGEITACEHFVTFKYFYIVQIVLLC